VLRSWAETDVGRVRTNNEDAYWLGGGEDWYLALVADGMGGHQAGEVASRVAVELIGRMIESANPGGKDGTACQELLVRAITEANREVNRLARSRPSLAGMGTTLSALLVHGREAELAHVGDSRVYRLRNGKLELLTEDHSLVQELINQGSLTPEEARIHPHRNILTRALGTEPVLKVDIRHEEVQPGDLFLLCTDGLTGAVTDAELEEVLTAAPRSRAAAELVQLANSRGGRDNVTVVLLEAGKEA
jgi:protein phosphatase